MNYVERGVSFDCQGDRLIGVACLPAVASDLGVLIVVGGPQYRAGSHRLFVRLARALASHGHASLRFDCRGMGDSEGEPRPFTGLSLDIAAAVDALVQEQPSVRRVVLWGLCDAASAALLYLDETGQDARVAGLCLLNPWVRSEATLAQTQVRHYYLDRLKQPEFWRKLLSGRVAASAVHELAGKLRLALRGEAAQRPHAGQAELPFQQRMARAWASFPGAVLLVLSGRDYTAKEFLQACTTDPHWRTALARPGLQRVDLVAADHTLSDADDAEEMLRACIEWLSVVATAGQPVSSVQMEERRGEDAHSAA
ncbi:MAG: hydrolase 1, exosortase A system-associated [Rubrivivax sp.]|nr:hydrolase 1, exosortase A system-associated [Rubrivivax sp.]